jgi:DNA-directed RNA polymerase specialized sigma24 family protein
VTPERLFDALRALQRGEPGLGPWQVVDRFLRGILPRERDADARQKTLLAIHRGVGAMQAETPAGAARWVRRIAQRKRIDEAVRGRKTRPISLTAASGEELDVPSPEAAAMVLDEGRLAQLLAEIEAELDALLAERFASPAARILPRAQARSRLLRTLDLPLPEIALALALPEPPSTATLSKWIERGLPLLSEAIERWGARSLRHAEFAAALRARVELRRADAGQDRPARRRGASVGPRRSRRRPVRPNGSSSLLLCRSAPVSVAARSAATRGGPFVGRRPCC